MESYNTEFGAYVNAASPSNVSALAHGPPALEPPPPPTTPFPHMTFPAAPFPPHLEDNPRLREIERMQQIILQNQSTILEGIEIIKVQAEQSQENVQRMQNDLSKLQEDFKYLVFEVLEPRGGSKQG